MTLETYFEQPDTPSKNSPVGVLMRQIVEKSRGTSFEEARKQANAILVNRGYGISAFQPIPLPPINPRTGKGWTDAEEEIISATMQAETCDRITAIQCARRRKQIGGTWDGATWQAVIPGKPRVKPIARTAASPIVIAVQDAPLIVPRSDYSHPQDAERPAITEIPVQGISEQNSVSEQEHLCLEKIQVEPEPPEPIEELPAVVEMPEREQRKRGRPRKWRSDAERMATVREQQKPLILPALPEGVYRAREVTAKAKAKPVSTARRNYHTALQGNRCFYCERPFGIYVQKNAARPEPLRSEDEHFTPRRLPGARKDSNRHAACHVCNGLKSDLVFSTEEQCRSWLAEAWQLNGYREVPVRAIHYLNEDRSVIFEERLAA